MQIQTPCKPGVNGHQAAVGALCDISKEEEAKIIESILKQKVGGNAKNMKAYQESKKEKDEQARKAEGQDDQPKAKLRVRKAKLSMGTSVKWTRSKREGNDTRKEEANEDRPKRIAYETIMLSCTRCGTAQETKWMQLHTPEGYKGVALPKLQKARKGSKEYLPMWKSMA